MINFGLVKLVNHGSTICFLALKMIFATMGLKNWFDYNQRKTLHVYGTTLYTRE